MRKKTVGLTAKQKEVLEFIEDWLEGNPSPPTVREICSGLDLASPSTIQNHLKQLEDKGFIRRRSAKSRSIEVVNSLRPQKMPEQAAPEAEEDRSVIKLPLVGRVAAGEPILAEQNIEEMVPLPVGLIGDRADYLLRVRGESMIDAGIYDGDFVVVREQKAADNGDIVVALIDEGATVKAYYREADRIRLQPRNETMDPIYTRDALILGKVIGLLRRF